MKTFCIWVRKKGEENYPSWSQLISFLVHIWARGFGLGVEWRFERNFVLRNGKYTKLIKMENFQTNWRDAGCWNETQQRGTHLRFQRSKRQDWDKQGGELTSMRRRAPECNFWIVENKGGNEIQKLRIILMKMKNLRFGKTRFEWERHNNNKMLWKDFLFQGNSQEKFSTHLFHHVRKTFQLHQEKKMAQQRQLNVRLKLNFCFHSFQPRRSSRLHQNVFIPP